MAETEVMRKATTSRGADTSDALERALETVVHGLGADLVDVEFRPGVVLVTVERREGLDLDDLAQLSRGVSDFLDAHDELTPRGRYQLEVSSPGLERRLRRAAHFVGARGERVAVRTIARAAGERRVEGALTGADDDGITVDSDDGSSRRLTYAEIDRAHVVFDWRRALAADSRNARGGSASTETSSR